MEFYESSKLTQPTTASSIFHRESDAGSSLEDSWTSRKDPYIFFTPILILFIYSIVKVLHF